MARRNPVVEELHALKDKGRGLLTPEAVVKRARDPKSALHAKFEWSDTEAARRYRLVQAADLIRLYVTVIHDPESDKTWRVRTFTSLPSDQRRGLGYRSTVEVMHNKKRRAEMVADALARLEAIRAKYEHLNELVDVWGAISSHVEVEEQQALRRRAG